jgi:prepilin-type processing-associated H-X9-DG protein
VPVFADPPDPNNPGSFSASHVVDILSRGNYVGMYGIGEVCAQSGAIDAPNNNGAGPQGTHAGIFYRNSATSIAAITDGTSNTTLFSEKLTGHSNPGSVTAGNNNPNQTRRVWFSTGLSQGRSAGVQNAASILAMIAACKTLAPTKAATGSVSETPGWFRAYPAYSNYAVYIHTGTPNSRNCGNNDWVPWGQDMWGTSNATSLHPGGVNAGMADGSVKFMKDTVNLPTWWALGTRSGGEVISSDAY